MFAFPLRSDLISVPVSTMPASIRILDEIVMGSFPILGEHLAIILLAMRMSLHPSANSSFACNAVGHGRTSLYQLVISRA